MYHCGDKKRDKLAPRKMIRVDRGTERRVEVKRHRSLIQQGTKVQSKVPIPNLPVQVPALKWARHPRRRSER